MYSIRISGLASHDRNNTFAHVDESAERPPLRRGRFTAHCDGCRRGSPVPRFTEARYQENFPGAGFSAAEIEFMIAIERYKREACRPFPTWHEVLRVLKSLGYRKPRAKPERREPRPHSE